MNFYKKFTERRDLLKSYLCIGLDPEWEKIPEFLKKESSPLYLFCKSIVDSTHRFAVAYKPNIAFFERFGSSGILQFEQLIKYLKTNYPSIPIIGDVKRGDLANTSKEYAKYYFQNLELDSITISPYMGFDSMKPYLEISNTHVFVLCLTSNQDSSMYQKIESIDNKFIYEKIAISIEKLNKDYPNRFGIVVGGTHPKEIQSIRGIAPSLSFLIPGYGAQGGTLEEIIPVCGENSLVNSSRSILFASNDENYAQSAEIAAQKIHHEMNSFFVN
jgi:orotidine-5'-phosphate decarboxylase